MKDTDNAFLQRMRGILTGKLCACGEPTLPHSDSCAECATALKFHLVRGQWFALPNGVGSDVGPFQSAAEAVNWIDGVEPLVHA